MGMHRRNYKLSTKSLPDSATTSSSEGMDINESECKQPSELKGIMSENWTCIVVQKTNIPKEAPPPIPHSRRSKFEKKKHKRKLSDSLHNLFNKKTKKNKGNEHHMDATDDGSYDGNAFNMDSGLEEEAIHDNHSQHNEQLSSTNVDLESEEHTIQWQWCDDDGIWHAYGKSTCKEIEKSYINKMDEYEYDVFGRIYTINFIKLKQRNNLNQTWTVRRQIM